MVLDAIGQGMVVVGPLMEGGLWLGHLQLMVDWWTLVENEMAADDDRDNAANMEAYQAVDLAVAVDYFDGDDTAVVPAVGHCR